MSVRSFSTFCLIMLCVGISIGMIISWWGVVGLFTFLHHVVATIALIIGSVALGLYLDYRLTPASRRLLTHPYRAERLLEISLLCAILLAVADGSDLLNFLQLGLGALLVLLLRIFWHRS